MRAAASGRQVAFGDVGRDVVALLAPSQQIERAKQGAQQQ